MSLSCSGLSSPALLSRNDGGSIKDQLQKVSILRYMVSCSQTISMRMVKSLVLDLFCKYVQIAQSPMRRDGDGLKFVEIVLFFYHDNSTIRIQLDAQRFCFFTRHLHALD